MSRNDRRRTGARALAVLAGALLALAPVLTASAASDEATGEEEKVSDGAIEVSYTETTEVRAGAGWLIDCGGVAALDGIEIACEPEGLTLTSLGFDADLGMQTLTVPQAFGATQIDVRYRVRLEPPPVPEIGTTRFDMPITVGEQALIPLSALDIVCSVCSVDGGATISVETLPDGVSAGVSPTHLAVRGSTVGDAVIPLTITDDAGQAVTAELTVSFVKAAVAAAEQGATHVVGDLDEIVLADLAWGEDAVVVCSPRGSIGLVCSEDGTLERAETGPAQLLFHVVSASGVTWGSITSPGDAQGMTLAAPSWESEAPLSIVSAPPAEEQQADAIAPLAGLAQLLEGIPAS